MRLEIFPAGGKITKNQALPCESAVAYGTYQLRTPESDRHYDYLISIFTHNRHPWEMPILFLNDPRLPAGNHDRHILSSGQACLGINAEIKNKWNPDAGLRGFCDDFVAPFLSWQLYYEVYGHAQPFGQRSHGAKGIIECYTELLGLSDPNQTLAFMDLLARRNRPQGHEPCACGSGRKLRDCHAELVNKVWGKFFWQNVRDDLAAIRNKKTLSVAKPHKPAHD